MLTWRKVRRDRRVRRLLAFRDTLFFLAQLGRTDISVLEDIQRLVRRLTRPQREARSVRARAAARAGVARRRRRQPADGAGGAAGGAGEEMAAVVVPVWDMVGAYIPWIGRHGSLE